MPVDKALDYLHMAAILHFFFFPSPAHYNSQRPFFHSFCYTTSMKDCIFCQIATKSASAQIVAETNDLIAFKDISPSAKTHILIIPKVHVSTFLDLDVSSSAAMLSLAQKLIKKYKLEKQYKLVINGGKNQIVSHFHLHLMGGKMKGMV